MHLTTLFSLTASLLASQVTAQNINPMLNPAAYLGNIDADSFADGDSNANPIPANFNPMAAYMAPAVTPSSTPSMPMSMTMSTHSAKHLHMPFHPSSSMGSMMTKARPSSMSKSRSMSMMSMATPISTPVHGYAQSKQIEQGSIAPVDAMQPGSQVAPVLMEKPHGKDIGNSFCMGSCFAHQSEAKCAKPYASAIYKSEQNCWMCCFTSPDF